MAGEQARRIDQVKDILIKVAKYFAHGILYSVVIALFTPVWVFLFFGLSFVGALLGILIAFVLLYILIGLANSVVTSLLWFPVRHGWRVYLGQGLALGLSLFFVEFVPLLLLADPLRSLSPSDQSTAGIVITVIYAFIAGLLGKAIGAHWGAPRVRAKLELGRLQAPPLPEPEVHNPEERECPRCHGKRLVVQKDQSAYCIDCRKGIHPNFWTARPA